MANSSALEILGVVIPSIFLVFICTTLATIFHDSLGKSRLRYVSDIFMIAIPYIFIITILVDSIKEVLIICVIFSLVIIILAFFLKENLFRRLSYTDTSDSAKSSIANVRASILLITVVAILAVDFKIFPKQFKKQIRYGYSLMDTGVGLFTFANAVTAPEIFNSRVSFKKTVLNTLPIILVGIGRYIATRLTDYNVQVTEYGKHWNFFITLAVTRLLGAFILKFINVRLSAVCGIVILIIHEGILQMGVANYVMSSGKRSNFFNSNREGIVSALGFLGLYMLSIGVGILLNLKNKKKIPKYFFILILTVICAITMSFTHILNRRIGLSRRLANSTYCLWMLFLSVCMILTFYLIEIVQNFVYKKFNYKAQITVPFLYEAINYNGLLYFLLANVLTGFVNMSCETLLMGPTSSIIILTCYMIVTSIVICFLYEKKINIKLFISLFTPKPKEKQYSV